MKSIEDLKQELENHYMMMEAYEVLGNHDESCKYATLSSLVLDEIEDRLESMGV